MKFISWLALIVAIIALVLSWVAFNRTGEDLDARISDVVDEVMMEVADNVIDPQVDIEDDTLDEEEVVEDRENDETTEEDTATTTQ